MSRSPRWPPRAWRGSVFHPDQPESQRANLLGLCRDLGLVATGGSDDHGRLTGHRIGCEVTAADAYDALVSQAASPQASQSDKARLSHALICAAIPHLLGYGWF